MEDQVIIQTVEKKKKVFNLAQREKMLDLVALLASDMNTTQIAEIFNLSPRTVEPLKDNARVFLEVKNTTALAYAAITKNYFNEESIEERVKRLLAAPRLKTIK